MYADQRPKDQVEDPAFARTFGLLDAVVMQLESQMPGKAGIALVWAATELDDYSKLEPTEQVGYDLSGRDVLEVLEEVRGQVADLARESSKLATTLRYLRAEAYLSEAAAAVAVGTAAPTGQE